MKSLTSPLYVLLFVFFAFNLKSQCTYIYSENHTCNLQIPSSCVGQSFIPDCLSTVNSIIVTSNSDIDLDNVTLNICEERLLTGKSIIFTQNGIKLKGKVNGNAINTIVALSSETTGLPVVTPPTLTNGIIRYYFYFQSAGNVDLKIMAYQGLSNFLSSLCTAVTTTNLLSLGLDIDLGFQLNLAEPLDVQLTSFIGSNSNGKNLLQWQTASEYNNSFFEIQSQSGSKEFKSIGQVKGAGNSTSMQTYQFVDDQPESNVTYYRLKQVDFDGKFQYSKVVTVVNVQKSGIAVYPNPTSTKLVLQTEKDEIGSVRIYQINGQLVYAQKIPASMANIDVSSFVNGIYVVETITDTGTHLSRFIKN